MKGTLAAASASSRLIVPSFERRFPRELVELFVPTRASSLPPARRWRTPPMKRARSSTARAGSGGVRLREVAISDKCRQISTTGAVVASHVSSKYTVLCLSSSKPGYQASSSHHRLRCSSVRPQKIRCRCRGLPAIVPMPGHSGSSRQQQHSYQTGTVA